MIFDDFASAESIESKRKKRRRSSGGETESDEIGEIDATEIDETETDANDCITYEWVRKRASRWTGCFRWWRRRSIQKPPAETIIVSSHYHSIGPKIR